MTNYWLHKDERESNAMTNFNRILCKFTSATAVANFSTMPVILQQSTVLLWCISLMYPENLWGRTLFTDQLLNPAWLLWELCCLRPLNMLHLASRLHHGCWISQDFGGKTSLPAPTNHTQADMTTGPHWYGKALTLMFGSAALGSVLLWLYSLRV